MRQNRRNVISVYIWLILIMAKCKNIVTQHVKLPPIQHTKVEEILEQAHQNMQHVYLEFNKNIYNEGRRQNPGSPAWYMSLAHTMKPEVYNLSHTSLIVEEATRYMADEYHLSKEQITFALSEMDVSDTTMGKTCPMSVKEPCEARKYRAISGYCNNVQNPRWGNANTKYTRLLMPAYEDGISLPRGGGITNRNTLPGPRTVSLTVHADREKDKEHDYLNVMAVEWAEFILHDISHTPFVTGLIGEKIKCCGVNFNDFHPECFPIRLSDSGNQKKDRCQEFIRSASGVRTGCTLGPREQINQATAFLDASHLYGNSRDELKLLRKYQSGRLKEQKVGRENFMPGDENVACRNNSSEYNCFLSGDIRANENIGIATLYTLWLREHNRIASELNQVNPHWNDETLFQETRRIIIAELQHITYNEFLPTILSQNIINKYDLNLVKNGYYLNYDINKNPSAINSVAHAAMWFIATLMPDVLQLANDEQDDRKIIEFSGTFFAPFDLYRNDGYKNILIAMLESSTRKDDAIINDAMINDMYRDSSYKGAGLDLAAQIIQRGRDHGLPSYTEWRKFCGLKPVNNFNDLNGITTPKIKNLLQKLYKNITDIDLFTGALAEISMLGSVIGPTFNCLLGHQFQATRSGDRHWYENNMPPSVFKLKQLEEIRQVTLSRLICYNSDIEEIQSNAFLKADFYLNQKMPCNTFKKLNLNHWKLDSSQIVIDTEILKSFISQAENDVLEINKHDNLQYALLDSPSSKAFQFNRPKRQAALIANTSLLLQLASARIVSSYIPSFQDQEATKRIITNEEFQRLMSVLPEIDVTNILDIPQNLQCLDVELPCDHTTPYRSISGRCNNLNNPEFGRSMRSFNRLLTPAYDDGIGSPKQTSTAGGPLPSARLVSSNLHPDFSSPHKRYSLMLMQMAQITDHDLTHTPVNVKHLGAGVLDCSPCKITASGCIPIPVPNNDPFYPNLDPNTNEPKCIPVTRSLPSRLTLGYREQMNQVTGYIDSSFIYGSDICEMKQLRLFSSGKLNATEKLDAKPLLPETDTNPECRTNSRICFRAGDLRASEQPGLASLHTIFLREHNRIAGELAKLNRHWTDEEIFQQTRRIIIAITQHIIFSELLPRIFGWEQLEKYGLSLEKQGYFNDYDPHCDSTLVNEFASAAYRFGHSLLRPTFKRMNNKHAVQEPEIRLRDHFFNPKLLYKKNMIDEILLGLAGTPMETLDQFVTNEVTNHLFEDKNIAYSGMDLPAINIQRGRDHGIPGYNNYRQFCNLTKANNFDDLSDLIPTHVVEILKQLYNNVDDIDLFPGGLVEYPLKGGIIGPTFACIVGNQFKRLRKCDRFWYETNNPFTRFTMEQLSEIRKTTLSRLVCDNTNSIVTIQKSLLDMPDPFLNPRLPCRNFEPLNLEFWKEQKRCFVKDTIIETGSYEKISPCVICVCTKEGTICESVKIDNCYDLAKQHSWDSILKDSICKVQCARAFNTLQQTQHLYNNETTIRHFGFT